MNFPLFMHASIRRVPFGNCRHSPSTCTFTIATSVAVSVISQIVFFVMKHSPAEAISMRQRINGDEPLGKKNRYI
jgi:hypothetical protein